MAIVYPNEAVRRRWNGALEARLRRAPLEGFLRWLALKPAPPGASQDTDNLVRATVAMVEAGLALSSADYRMQLRSGERMALGHVTSLVGLALVQEIAMPEAWRNVALIGATQCLSPHIGLRAAAAAAVAAVRQFRRDIMTGVSPRDWRIMNTAGEAIRRKDQAAMDRAASYIAALLNAESGSGLLLLRASS